MKPNTDQPKGKELEYRVIAVNKAAKPVEKANFFIKFLCLWECRIFSDE